MSITIYSCNYNKMGNETMLLLPGNDFSTIPLTNEIVSNLAESTPIIDGNINLLEWKDASAYRAVLDWYDVNNYPTGKKTEVIFLAKNNGNKMYLAIRYDDPFWNAEYDSNNNAKQMDIASITFDKNSNGIIDTGDDKKSVLPIFYSLYLDSYLQNNSGFYTDDDQFNGIGRMVYHEYEHRYHVEFEIPFSTGDLNDISILPGDPIGIDLSFINNYNETYYTNPIFEGVAYLFKNYPNAMGASIGTLKTATATPSAQEPLPNFTGKMVIRDCRDFEKGDFYIYNFSTKTTTRITNGNSNPAHNFYKDNPSMSPDRQWIVFHGSSDKNNLYDYKLYKIKTDGTGFMQLPNIEGELRAHPAWSPDGTEIAYVSLTPGNQNIPRGGNIHIMNTNGALLRIVTTTYNDNNDPDWIPDPDGAGPEKAKIIFKSNRWTSKEQLCIINADECATDYNWDTVVRRLTYNIYSDHDPVLTADGTWIVFDRFVPSGTFHDFESNPWSLKDPRWKNNIFEIWKIKPNGTGEQKIEQNSSNIVIQWLPVGERSSAPGKGIAWIRNLGINYSIIMWQPDGQGTPLQIIPQLTCVTYIDWK